MNCKGFDWEAGLALFLHSGHCALDCRLKKALDASPSPWQLQWHCCEWHHCLKQPLKKKKDHCAYSYS